jgi:hypothetical protein
LLGNSSGCAFSTVGKGLPGWTDLGNWGSWTTGSDGTGVGAAGVTDLSGGVAVRFLATCSTRAAARGGSFRFLSIVIAVVVVVVSTFGVEVKIMFHATWEVS